MPQPPVKVALQETSQPQPVDSEKGSEDREMMTPNRPDLPEDQLEPAESPQQVQDSLVSDNSEVRDDCTFVSHTQCSVTG